MVKYFTIAVLFFTHLSIAQDITLRVSKNPVALERAF